MTLPRFLVAPKRVTAKTGFRSITKVLSRLVKGQNLMKPILLNVKLIQDNMSAKVLLQVDFFLQVSNPVDLEANGATTFFQGLCFSI